MKLTLKQALFSKTVLSGALLILMNSLEFITSPTNPLHLSTSVMVVMNLILGAINIHGRVNPKQGADTAPYAESTQETNSK